MVADHPLRTRSTAPSCSPSCRCWSARRRPGRPGSDAPGRHEPGTGTLDLGRYLALLAAAGYSGWVGLEYQPSGASADSFAWLPRQRRQGGAT